MSEMRHSTRSPAALAALLLPARVLPAHLCFRHSLERHQLLVGTTLNGIHLTKTALA